MITRERIKRIFNLEYYGNPEGAGQCSLSEAIDRASDRILTEIEPDKPKTLVEYFLEQYPGIPDYGERACWSRDREAVKNWLASKPKEMTVEQLLAELEKEEKE